MSQDGPDLGWLEEQGEGRETSGRARRRGRRRRRRRGVLRRLDRPRRIVLRDFLIYELKLFLDGAKGFVISWAAIGAVAVDMILPGDTPGRRFYAVMRIGERLDNWLSLYGVAEAAEEDADGMFGVSRAGSPTLLGRLEALAHRVVVGTEGDFDDDAREKARAHDGAESTEEEEPHEPQQEP